MVSRSVIGSGCRRPLRMRVWPGRVALLLAAAWMAASGTAWGAHATDALDEPALVQLETHAGQADPRERCFLYAEVLAALTELEGRQISAGHDEEARITMRRMNEVAAKIQAASLANAKKLKDAEQVLERVTHRLHDMVRAVSTEQQAGMQQTFQHVSTVHSEVLTMVFAH